MLFSNSDEPRSLILTTVFQASKALWVRELNQEDRKQAIESDYSQKADPKAFIGFSHHFAVFPGEAELRQGDLTAEEALNTLPKVQYFGLLCRRS